MISRIDCNLLDQIKRDRAAYWNNRPKKGPGKEIRQRQYELWRSGVATSHSITGAQCMGLEQGAQTFTWPDKEPKE